ncbi:CynX/NimT family MFS transporter [Sporosarcina beigongshangi]|uniref:CynX/NimT family MFS transporter n=1 Tax=Sporosarcina beigongshangi TaxID=2782538 RepID=UPI0019397AD2|nr:MFS transporter [Sporosarcina beigongshangi]
MTTQHVSRRLKFTRNTWFLLIGIVFIALTLRSPLTTVGPLISSIRDSLGISNVLAGFLTTIPLLAFAIISPFAPRLARRFGMELTLFCSLILLTAGIIIRSLGTVPTLLIGTFLLGLAIAFGNVLLPSLIKLSFPLQIGLMTGIYSVSMNLSASIAIGVSVPLAQTSFGWQGALGMWSMLALIALLVWLPQLKNKRLAAVPEVAKEKIPLWRSPLAWSVTLFMGFQSLLFYTTSAWLPEVLKAQGISADSAGWLVSLLQFSQLPITFIIPIIAGKVKDQRMIVVGVTTLYILGYGGVLLNITSLTALWMIMIGLAGGAAFGLAMMFFTLRTRTAQEAANLSGMAQSFGYALAAVGPVLFGLLHDFTAGWTMPMLILIVASIVVLLAGMKAGKNVFVLSPESK